MGVSKRNKKTVWIYAVVLFTSAFIVLLLTAYSQIKFNRNIVDYQEKLVKEESSKNIFKSNLNIITEENKRLKNDIDKLKEENSKISDNLEKLQKESTKVLSNNKDDKYESLLLAEKLYDEGDIVSCAELLYKLQLSTSSVGVNGFDRYTYLVNKTFKAAAEKLYFEGYNNYMKGQYESSIKKFRLSFNLEKNDYYSDDCLFLMSLSEIRTGDIENAKNHLNEILANYQDSTYTGEVKSLINDISLENK